MGVADAGLEVRQVVDGLHAAAPLALPVDVFEQGQVVQGDHARFLPTVDGEVEPGQRSRIELPRAMGSRVRPKLNGSKRTRQESSTSEPQELEPRPQYL